MTYIDTAVLPTVAPTTHPLIAARKYILFVPPDCAYTALLTAVSDCTAYSPS